MQTILQKIFLKIVLLGSFLLLTGCWTWKRSDCPTYRDSDPRVIFGGGEESFADELKKEEEKYAKKRQKDKDKLAKEGRKQQKKAAKLARKRKKN